MTNKENRKPVVTDIPSKLPPGIGIRKCEKSAGEGEGSRGGEGVEAQVKRQLPRGIQVTRVERANTGTELPMMEEKEEVAAKEKADMEAGEAEELVVGKAEGMEAVEAASPVEVLASIHWAEVFKISAAAKTDA